MLTGDNSILKQATNAKEQTQDKTEDELIKISVGEILTDNLNTEIMKDDLEEKLSKNLNKEVTLSENNNNDGWIYQGINKSYNITKSGVITEIEEEENNGEIERVEFEKDIYTSDDFIRSGIDMHYTIYPENATETLSEEQFEIIQANNHMYIVGVADNYIQMETDTTDQDLRRRR